MSIFAIGIKNGMIRIEEPVRIILLEWFVSQPMFIRALFPDFISEAGLESNIFVASEPILCQEAI